VPLHYYPCRYRRSLTTARQQTGPAERSTATSSLSLIRSELIVFMSHKKPTSPTNAELVSNLPLNNHAEQQHCQRRQLN
jgi:hypothetical protein